MLDDLIRMICRIDSGYRNRLRGATEAEISRFGLVVGADLPRVYQEYLTVMGHDNGGLRLFGDASCDIDSIIAVYQEEVESGNFDVLPKGYAIIGADGPVDGFGFLEL